MWTQDSTYEGERHFCWCMRTLSREEMTVDGQRRRRSAIPPVFSLLTLTLTSHFSSPSMSYPTSSSHLLPTLMLIIVFSPQVPNLRNPNPTHVKRHRSHVNDNAHWHVVLQYQSSSLSLLSQSLITSPIRRCNLNVIVCVCVCVCAWPGCEPDTLVRTRDGCGRASGNMHHLSHPQRGSCVSRP